MIQKDELLEEVRLIYGEHKQEIDRLGQEIKLKVEEKERFKTDYGKKYRIELELKELVKEKKLLEGKVLGVNEVRDIIKRLERIDIGDLEVKIN